MGCTDIQVIELALTFLKNTINVLVRFNSYYVSSCEWPGENFKTDAAKRA